jgi:hypothetical protein
MRQSIATQKSIRLVLTLLISFLLFQSLSAQHISVESLRMLENDMDARVHHPKRDQNGEVAALIKIVTTETGFSFDGGSLGIVATEQKVAEIWVYVPRGAQRITIMHPKLGVLRTYAYPISIEAATVYEMRLVTGRVETTVIPPEINSQWLVITSEPDGADVYINNDPVGTTPYYNELPVGDYTWRLSANLYQPAAGVITLEAGDDKRIEIHEILKPDYGTLIVRSSPESGAAITINGFETGQTTPATIPRIKSGEVLITLRLSDYETTSEQIELEAGSEQQVDISMRPTFAVVTVETDPTSDIFIGDQRRGSGRWEGRLGAGIYTFEARLDKHRPATERRQVNAQENFTLNLNPQPITGNLRVISSPHGAGIRIAGTEYGTTPTTIRNLLIGEYNVELSLSGHASVTERVTIKENETAEINTTLPAGMEVTITSKPTGAELFINNHKVGTTPYTGELSFGSQNIKMVNRSRTIEETINVQQDGNNNFNFNIAEKVQVTITSIPDGVELFINNQKVGTTPYKGELFYGSHKVKLINRDKTVEETIQVKQSGPTTFSFDRLLIIGDRAHGGIVFYLDGKGSGLLCAESDQSTAAEWGCYRTTIGGTDTGILTGAANTSKILAGCSEAGNATRICNDLVLNGYSDWFLPSKDELNLMYQNLKLAGIGGFADGLYWSSSEYSSGNAWLQLFTNGNQNGYDKYSLFRVRAVRAF